MISFLFSERTYCFIFWEQKVLEVFRWNTVLSPSSRAFARAFEKGPRWEWGFYPRCFVVDWTLSKRLAHSLLIIKELLDSSSLKRFPRDVGDWAWRALLQLCCSCCLLQQLSEAVRERREDLTSLEVQVTTNILGETAMKLILTSRSSYEVSPARERKKRQIWKCVVLFCLGELI